MSRKHHIAGSSMKRLIQGQSNFDATVQSMLTKDGLLPTSCMHLAISSDRYNLSLVNHNEISAFPAQECDLVTNYLVEDFELWRQAAIRVNGVPTIWGSMPAFGVSFPKAVEIAIKTGRMKSKFYFPERAVDGRYKTLLLHLCMVDDKRGKMIQLQAWQYTPGDGHAHYIHALSPDFRDYLCHMDGATIGFSGADLDVLLNQSKKVKGFWYKKHFRLDGSIRMDDMHKIAAAFLPGEDLYEEAFELSHLD